MSFFYSENIVVIIIFSAVGVKQVARHAEISDIFQKGVRKLYGNVPLAVQEYEIIKTERSYVYQKGFRKILAEIL